YTKRLVDPVVGDKQKFVFGIAEMKDAFEYNAIVARYENIQFAVLNGRNIFHIFRENDAAGWDGQHGVAADFKSAIGFVARQHGYADLGKAADELRILKSRQVSRRSFLRHQFNILPIECIYRDSEDLALGLAGNAPGFLRYGTEISIDQVVEAHLEDA